MMAVQIEAMPFTMAIRTAPMVWKRLLIQLTTAPIVMLVDVVEMWWCCGKVGDVVC